MRKHLGIVKTAVVAALGLLLFAACVNPLELSPERASAGGKGVVRIETGAGAARTAIPNAAFDHYQYLFSKGGEAAIPMTPSGEGPEVLFELEQGSWSVTVKAFAETGEETLAAEGTTDFSITTGAETPVTVRLSPVVNEGTGTLDYTLSYPAGTKTKSFTLTLLAGETDISLIDAAVIDDESNPEMPTLSGTLETDSGYYLVRAAMEKNGNTIERTEVAHIYKNLVTELELEFVEDDFKAIVVVSSADSGPGTLRDALTKARSVSGATILIDLPSGDRVITLATPLPSISQSITIEGNGTTLTQNNFTPTNTSQLLYFPNSGNANIRIRRLHFRGGRATAYGGAINNNGAYLTLESCVFSDNKTGGSGGAIYTSGTLTVLGCTFYGNSAGNLSYTGNYGGAIYRNGSQIYLTGNIFWGNTAYRHHVIYTSSVSSVVSRGFNISDRESGTTATTGSGWTFHTTDKQATSLPVSFFSFRPFEDGSALNVITTKPATYPDVDFYGVDMPGANAAAGAVQTPTTGNGFILNYGPQGPGAVSVQSGTVDADGFTSGDVTLTAVPDPGKAFIYWIVDDEVYPEQTPAHQLALNITAHTKVRAVFGVIHTPNNADTGTGSLREVLGIVSDGDKIVLPAGQTITLETPLPPIIKSILIEGNGAVLTQTGFTESNTSQLLYISGATAEVRIGRLHFKGGRAVSYGGAIQNTGVLILESCIFSDNKTSSTSALGGAIHTNRYLTVSGCTFYGNNAGTTTGQGGAIYGSATLTGNVFWGNTASYNSVVYGTNTTTNGFNISDKANGTDISTGSGWIFGSTDKRNPLPVSPLSLRPVADGALAVITTKPANYPAVDFYGVDIPGTNAAAGAIQTAPLGSGYILDYGSRGPGAVSVQSGTVDGDGLISGSVTLAAAEEANGKFMHWTVDGAKQPPQSSPAEFTVIADDHKTVRGVFYTLVTDTGNDTPGSLREALSSEDNGGGVILPAGQTIALTGTLPSITKDLIIEGNGTTLTQNGTGRFLGIGANAVVRINRLHFKESKPPTGSGNSGGAITNSGALILESCIFSGNRTGGSSNGGAVYNNNTGSLTVLGCTFNENNAGGRGGAIFNGNGSSAVILIGNIFQANIASSHKVVYSDNVLSYGYNVSDRASGIAATSSGWTFSNGDIQMADVNFNADFVPSSASLPVISLPLLSSQEFPALYFNGTSRGSSSAPGAMPPAVEP